MIHTGKGLAFSVETRDDLPSVHAQFDHLEGSSPVYGLFRFGQVDVSDAPAPPMPLIGDRWGSHFTWSGKGPMPSGERAKLASIVERAHAKELLTNKLGVLDAEILRHDRADRWCRRASVEDFVIE